MAHQVAHYVRLEGLRRLAHRLEALPKLHAQEAVFLVELCHELGGVQRVVGDLLDGDPGLAQRVHLVPHPGIVDDVARGLR